MPLHLLSKKSWNVYNPTSIERVRADEAAAKAREEAEEQRQDEHEAACRFAKLRGLPSPPPLEPLPKLEPQRQRKRERDESDGRDDDRRRRRRRHGEDDTDRDIRHAQERSKHTSRDDDKRMIRDRRGAAASTTDHAGNIQLFAPPSTRDIKAQRNAEAEAEKRRKKQELEEQYTMRFSNAAGRHKGANLSPWYASSAARYSGTEELDEKALTLYSASSGLDAFGREDAGRVDRDMGRRKTADPMTAMLAGQSQLKMKKAKERVMQAERESELRDLKRDERERRRADRRHDIRQDARHRERSDRRGADSEREQSSSHGRPSYAAHRHDRIQYNT